MAWKPLQLSISVPICKQMQLRLLQPAGSSLASMSSEDLFPSCVIYKELESKQGGRQFGF